MREFVRPVAAALEHCLPRGLDGHRCPAPARWRRPSRRRRSRWRRLRPRRRRRRTAAAEADGADRKADRGRARGAPRTWMRSPRSCRRTPSRIRRSLAQLDGVAKKNGFASYDEYNNVIDNISLVLAGFDPATKKYVGTEAVIKAQIAQVQADKKMSAKDKKEALADLNEALKSPAPRDREQGQYRSRRQILRQARRSARRRRPISAGR